MMTITLIAIVTLMAVFLGWIVSQTINVEPWRATTEPGDGHSRLPAFLTTPHVGLIVLLAAITSLFALMISAYNGRMMLSGDWRSVDVPGVLWINTAILVLCSIALHTGLRAFRQGRLRNARIGFAIGGMGTLLFIAGQIFAWFQLADDGRALAGNPASAFFVLVTALHALHLLGGLVAWLRAMVRLFGAAGGASARAGMELCTIYWHYLLAVWFLLFGLILST